MCYHRLYIFTTCGHSLFHLQPLQPCRKKSSIPPYTTCAPLAHPYQSLKIHRLCLACTRQRDALIAQIESGQEIRFEDWRWRVAYRSPIADEESWRTWGDDGGAKDMGMRKKRTDGGLLRVGFGGS